MKTSLMIWALKYRSYSFYCAELIKVVALLIVFSTSLSASSTVLLVEDNLLSNNTDEHKDYFYPSYLSKSNVFEESWSYSPKAVLVIRANYPDSLGLPGTKEEVLNEYQKSSEELRSFSYRKVYFSDISVSDAVITAPKSTSEYGTNIELLISDLSYEYSQLNPSVDLGQFDIIAACTTRSSYDPNSRAALWGSVQRIVAPCKITDIVHETGHNLGLRHSNSFQGSNGNIIGNGQVQEYADIFDRMGNNFYAKDFNSSFKYYINWIPDPDVASLDSSQRIKLYQHDHIDSSGLRGIYIPKENGHWYWIGKRSNPLIYGEQKWIRHGVQMRWWGGNSHDSLLIDLNPDTSSLLDSPLTLGRTYTDTDCTNITALEKGGKSPNEWVDVQVNLGCDSTNHAPIISLTVPETINPRETVSIVANASDLDGDELAYQWSMGDGKILNNTLFDQLEYYWEIGGTYNIEVTVSDMRGGTNSQTIQIHIEDPLNDALEIVKTSEDTSPYAFTHIVEGGGKILALLTNTNYPNGSEVFTSTDGRVWSERPTEYSCAPSEPLKLLYCTDMHVKSLKYFNGSWFVAGNELGYWGTLTGKSEIYTSIDGIYWASVQESEGEMVGLEVRDGLLVAAKSGGEILTSNDGINWQIHTPTIPQNIVDLVATEDFFLIMAIEENKTYIYRSVDGLYWEKIASLLEKNAIDNVRLELNYQKNILFQSGYYNPQEDNTEKQYYIRSSHDQGASWSNEFPLPSNLELKKVAIINGVYVALLGGGYTENQIFISNNGNDWIATSSTTRDSQLSALTLGDTLIIGGSSMKIWGYLVPEGIAGINDMGWSDLDLDNISFDIDNCPYHHNVHQSDLDQDGLGDPCDADDDNDLVSDVNDNCPTLENVDQLDSDKDLIGDVCDTGDDRIIVIAKTDGNGSIDAYSKPTILGATQSFTAIPHEGYEVEQVVGGSCPSGSWNGLTYTTGLITLACHVNFTHSIKEYTVNPLAGANGSIAPSTPQQINHNTSSQFTVLPLEGYLASVGGSCGGQLDGNVYTTNSIKESCTVEALFSIKNYVVSTSFDSARGDVIPSWTMVDHGDSTEFTISVDPGYRITNVAGCGGAWVGSNPFTTGPVVSECSIDVTFKHEGDNEVTECSFFIIPGNEGTSVAVCL